MSCAVAADGYRAALQAPADVQPRLRGRPVTLARALAHAAQRLQHSRLPLFSGLLGDLPESRALWRLAERCGAVVDHAGSAALCRVLSVAQMQGLITTSLGEARNRADLWLFIGEGVFYRQPRILERLLQPEERLHTESTPTVMVLGSGTRGALPVQAEYVNLESFSVMDVIGGIRALMHGHRVDAMLHPMTRELVARIQKSTYLVVALDPVELGDSTDEGLIDLDLLGIARLIRQRNEAGRAALLIMGAGDGLASFQQAGLWHNGFGLRTRHAPEGPAYDPLGHGTERMLREGGADLLLWHASLRPVAPPETEIPTLVFGHPGLTFSREPELFIPLAVPGIHRDGQIHRGDGLAILPLSAITTDRGSNLASGPGIYAELLARILEEKTEC
ncbi:MAG: hypothetical protein R6U98_08830 [Pirellulaceae bacterium]